MLIEAALETSRRETAMVFRRAPLHIRDGWVSCNRTLRSIAYQGCNWLLQENHNDKAVKAGTLTLSGYSVQSNALCAILEGTYLNNPIKAVVTHDITEVIPGKLYAMLPPVSVMTRRPGSHSMLIHLVFKVECGDRLPHNGLRLVNERKSETGL